MARNINYEFHDKLLEYMRNQWIKNGMNPFSITIRDICAAIGEDPNKKQEKVFHYLNILEQAGYIQKVGFGAGRRANTYIIPSNNIETQMQQIREKTVDSVEEVIDYFSVGLKKLNDLVVSLGNNQVEIESKVRFYENIFYQMKITGINFNNGQQEHYNISIPKNSQIEAILNEINQRLSATNEKPV